MIYLASPFFNPQQDRVVESLKSLMEVNWLEYYSPKDEFRVNFKVDSPEKMKECFEANCTAIKKADLVLAVIDDFDPGTIWEVGYAYSLGKPVIAYSDVPGRGLNLMLAQSCKGFCNGLENLNRVLKRYSESNSVDSVVWKGEVI